MSSFITLTPAGDVPLSAGMDDSNTVLVEIGGQTRRMSREGIAAFLDLGLERPTDGRNYASRQAFLDDITATSYAPPDGTVVTAGFISYVRYEGATEVSDLPGWRYFVGAIRENVTFTIPADFPDIQAALDFISTCNVLSSVKITLNIATGHALTKGFTVTTDLSFVTITSTDATVTLAASFEAASVVGPAPEYGDCVVYVWGGKSPQIEFLCNLDDITISGHFCGDYGTISYAASCGFINGRIGGEVRSAHFRGRAAVFTGHWSSGLRFTDGSKFSCGNSDLSGCMTAEPNANNGALMVSRGSSGNAQQITVANSGARGVAVRRSFLAMQGATITGCSKQGLELQEGAHVVANGSTITGNTINDIYFQVGGGQVFASGATYGSSNIVANEPQFGSFLHDADEPRLKTIVFAYDYNSTVTGGVTIPFPNSFTFPSAPSGSYSLRNSTAPGNIASMKETEVTTTTTGWTLRTPSGGTESAVPLVLIATGYVTQNTL